MKTQKNKSHKKPHSRKNKTHKNVKNDPVVKILPINFPLYGAKKYRGDKILEYTQKNATQQRTKCIGENISWFGNYERAALYHLHLWTFKSPKIGDLSVTKATLPRTFSMSEGVKSHQHINKWLITRPTSLAVITNKNKQFFEFIFAQTNQNLQSCISLTERDVNKIKAEMPTPTPTPINTIQSYLNMSNNERSLYEFKFIYGYLTLREQYDFLVFLQLLLKNKYLKVPVNTNSFILDNIGNVIRYYDVNMEISNKKYRKMNRLGIYSFETTIMTNLCKLFHEQGYSHFSGIYVPKQTSFWILFSSLINNIEEYILFNPHENLITTVNTMKNTSKNPYLSSVISQ